MADDLSIFGGLPGEADDERIRKARRALRMRNMFEPEGPLPPRPRPSGVGGMTPKPKATGSKPFAVIASVSSFDNKNPSAPIDTTGADLLVMNLAATSAASAVPVDSYNNAWLTAIDSNGAGEAIFYCSPPSNKVGPGHTFRCNTTRGWPATSVGAFAGSASTPLDQTAMGAVSALTAGPITPSVANTLVVSGYCANGGTATPTSGFTLLTTSGNSGNYTSSLIYQTQTTPTAVTATWAASNPVQAAIASFKLASAPTSTWSAADASANAMTLTNGGMTVTWKAGTAPSVSIRGTVSRSTGKYYVEFLGSNVSPSSGGNTPGWGFADAGFNSSSYLGNSPNSVGMLCRSGGNYASAGFAMPNGIVAIPATGDVWALAVDLTAGQFWIAQNNVWFFGGNPGSAVNPYGTMTAPALGLAYFPGMLAQGDASGPWTLQPTAASQKYAPPSGFTAWG